MASIITVAQRKGGSGKTTLLVQLATAWAKAGRSIALIDSDPQGSLTAWFDARSEDLPAIQCGAAEGWKVSSEVSRLGRKADIVLIDTPPHAETAAKAAIRQANLVLIPMQPSPVDLWATKESLAVSAQEKTPSLVVLNRVPPRGKVIDTIRDMIEDRTEVATNTLGNRQAFAGAFLEGKGIVDLSRPGKAGDEVIALAREIAAKLT